jgi:hypothetical protein
VNSSALSVLPGGRGGGGGALKDILGEKDMHKGSLNLAIFNKFKGKQTQYRKKY